MAASRFRKFCAPTWTAQSKSRRRSSPSRDLASAALAKEDLFFETTSEAMLTWLRVKDVALEMRESRRNPLYMRNLEMLAERQEQWLAARAPSAIEETKKMIAGMKKQAAAAKK